VAFAAAASVSVTFVFGVVVDARLIGAALSMVISGVGVCAEKPGKG